MRSTNKKPTIKTPFTTRTFHTFLSGLALGLSLTLTAPPALAAGDSPLFEVNGKSYSASQLSEGGRLGLYAVESKRYQGLAQLLDKELLARYFQEEAKRLGKSVEEVRTEQLTVAEPAEKDIRAMYEKQKGRMSKSYEQMRDWIAGYLKKQAVRDKKAALVAEYREKTGARLLLPEPVAPVVKIDTEGAPVMGPQDARVTIVEFADYRCGYCKKAADAIGKVMARFEGKVKLVYMDYPILGSDSRAIAEGGVCAASQGKFQPYHIAAYEKQGEWHAGNLVQMAGAIGLDSKAFEACLKSGKAADQVKRTESEAKRLYLTGTPSIFVNGEKFQGGRNMEDELAGAVEKALAE